MPTIAGRSIYARDNVPNWVDWHGSEALGASMQAAFRGHPPPLSSWMMRPRLGPESIPQGVPLWRQSRPYDRGSAAYAPKFGVIPVNPIGAGTYTPYRLMPSGGPAARYQFGAIWFDVQTIPTSMPMSRGMPLQAANALIAHSHVAANYRTTG